MRVNELVIAGAVALAGIMLWSSTATAARISDVTNTKHNFSAIVAPQSGTDGASRTVRATSESEICVFCHTPHGADNTEGPLWNKTLPAASSYTRYTSSSIDSNIGQVNGVSKLCLSCHDGTIAIGSVRNVRTEQRTIVMQGTSGGDMPAGEGVNTGYTRNLGQDLRNDHPISLTYTSSFVNTDGEMRAPGDDPLRVRGRTPRPGIQDIHLQPVNMGDSDGQVQCISCHDPHIRDTTDDNIKFLRFNRLQTAPPSSANGSFLPNSDIICLACHTKAGWSTSAHAQPNIANEAYTNAAADTREFPRGTRVWETACLACHDTHTVQGSRRLLRAGTDAGTFSSDFGYQIKSGGGDPAIEETCYACHSSNGGTLQGQGGGSFEVPDIRTDFQMNRHMPITSSDQGNNTEVHDITDADFMESQNNLGNRHAECTDCHNPHRVVKRRSFNQTNAGGNDDAEGTHAHVNGHTNIASGVLRGIWGVEPRYSSNSFHNDPSGFDVKSGEPNSTNTGVGNTYLTREYQVCLKCHSNYAFNGGYNGPPSLGGSGLTPSGTNGMTRYTNIAREFNSPGSHAGEPRTTSDGGSNYDTNNHRSWHPVMQSTQRNAGDRNASNNLWLSPFQAVGSQTMYCSDCHGSGTGNTTVEPNGGVNGSPWGPHGSNNDFILKGPWSGGQTTGTGEGQQNHLCFKCHDYTQYADGNNNNPLNSGFQLDPALGDGGGGMTPMAISGGGTAGLITKAGGGGDGGGGGGGGDGGGGDGGGGGMGCMGGGMTCMGAMADGMNNLHIFHANQVNNFRCNLCHVAVPHGWKNKNFLVNLNDIGAESTRGNNGQVRNGTTAGYVDGPYYNRAVLKVVQFGASGLWNPNFCGSQGGTVGVAWMAGGNEACNNVP